MAILNFKATESDAPGGGVHRIKTQGIRSGNLYRVVIKQSDYPDIDLSQLTANNFFKSTTCNASDKAQITSGGSISGVYYGGSTSISYSYSNGEGTVTITETNRKAYVSDNNSDTKSATFNHTIYMSKLAII